MCDRDRTLGGWCWDAGEGRGNRRFDGGGGEGCIDVTSSKGAKGAEVVTTGYMGECGYYFLYFLRWKYCGTVGYW